MKNKVEVSLVSNPMKRDEIKKMEGTQKLRVIKRKEPKKGEKNIFLEILNDYCQTSTLHGISYLGAKDKSLAEKIWWVLVFMMSVATCTYLITKTWIKWNTNPVILSFEKEQVPLSEIPFPAVTICPVNKVQQTKYNYTQIFRGNGTNLTTDEVKKFWDISLVCSLTETFGHHIEFPSAHTFTDELAVDNIRKIILHNPAEPPKAAQYYFLVPLNRKMVLIVRPDLTRTDKTVRYLAVQERKCYFSDEKTLRFFKIYTQSNCRTECEANFTNYYCGCVPFYAPRSKNTHVCGFKKTDCVKEALNVMLDLKSKFADIPSSYGSKAELLRDIFLACNCLPACATLGYTAETSHTELHTIESIVASGSYHNHLLSTEEKEAYNMRLSSATRVHIFFRDSQFLALKRSELFGQTDFFANCGGLLGLFMGFSLLSGLEIVYFFTIRLWIKFRNRRRNK